MKNATCPNCKKECQAVQIDDGIGEYEWWGQKCRQQILIWVSECCECEIEDFDSGDWEDEGAIADYEEDREMEAERYPV